MPTIFVDNRPYQVEEGQNLLQACLSLGFNLPYFCWHPAMHSVGACRQCAVKQFRDDKDTRGRIVMACMTPAAEGTRISIDDPDAKAFRAAVIEWLMTNHPHDCPVCDEGGECHLQDMTVMTGHNYRRYRFRKRTYRNQYLGPFVQHEMNRCIQCYRCVRFYRDYAGGRDFDVFASHNHVYFGRQTDGVLESEFSGNLVEVCPTGVFTDKPFREHYTRKWDLQTAPSLCPLCSLGCNTIPGERYGTLRRILNRYHGEVNGYFLCDRGRYGYEFVNSERRIRQPLLRTESSDEQKPAGKAAVLEQLASLLAAGGKVIGIGSPRASLEANYMLRCLVSPGRFYQGVTSRQKRLVSTALEVLSRGPARSASLREVRAADAVLVLGEDVTNYAPVLALALRQSIWQMPLREARRRGIPHWNDAMVRVAAQDKTGPLFLATSGPTKLDEVATEVCRLAPDDIACLGQAVAQYITGRSPRFGELSAEMQSRAARIAEALLASERPLVVSGTGPGSVAIIEAAANVSWALHDAGKQAGISLALPEANSLGLEMLGGGSLDDLLSDLRLQKADLLFVLENDLYRHASAKTVDEILGRCRHVIALDSLDNQTTARADIVLPAATYAEADGTLVNNEGRAQRFYQVLVPEGEVQESWRWLRDGMVAAGLVDALQWQSLDDVISSMVADFPAFGPVLEIAPPSSFRIVGQKIPRQPHRYSGRTAMFAGTTVHEPAPVPDLDTPLAFSMEGYSGQPPSPLIPRYWSPGWNSTQALNKFQQEVGGPLRGGDPGRRLLEPRSLLSSSYTRMPSVHRRRRGKWLVVPAYHIFGSEEFSVLSPGIAELAPEPYLGLRPEDAAAEGLREGMSVDLTLPGLVLHLPIRLVASLPAGVALLPAGLQKLPFVELPALGRLVWLETEVGGRSILGELATSSVVTLGAPLALAAAMAVLAWLDRRRHQPPERSRLQKEG